MYILYIYVNHRYLGDPYQVWSAYGIKIRMTLSGHARLSVLNTSSMYKESKFQVEQIYQNIYTPTI